MKIAIPSDHGGYSMKKFLAGYLLGRGYEILDLGTDSTDSVDYPAFGKACGEAVSSGQAQKGIVVCGTGIGISIAANKVKGIRCALCTSVEMAKLSRQHNDANILALGGRILNEETAVKIADAWLSTGFEGGRHERRVKALDEI